jgi:hypothetical protein
MNLDVIAEGVEEEDQVNFLEQKVAIRFKDIILVNQCLQKILIIC